MTTPQLLALKCEFCGANLPISLKCRYCGTQYERVGDSLRKYDASELLRELSRVQEKMEEEKQRQIQRMAARNGEIPFSTAAISNAYRMYQPTSKADLIKENGWILLLTLPLFLGIYVAAAFPGVLGIVVVTLLASPLVVSFAFPKEIHLSMTKFWRRNQK